MVFQVLTYNLEHYGVYAMGLGLDFKVTLL